MRYAVVETDNLGGDYPDESFVIRGIRDKVDAEKIVELINKHLCPEHSVVTPYRYWKVVEDSYTNPYKLAPGLGLES